MSDLIPGARKATNLDAIAMFNALDLITRSSGYSIGMTGSLVTDAEGNDIDFICAGTMDAKVSAENVANKIVRRLSKRLVEFSLITDDGSSVAIMFLTARGVIVDVYVIGLPEEVENAEG